MSAYTLGSSDPQNPNHYNDEFSTNVHMKAQQMGHKLEGFYVNEGIVGERKVIRRIGGKRLAEKTDRNASTPITETPRDTVVLIPREYDTADLIDMNDDIKSNIAPDSNLVQVHAAAVNTHKDKTLIQAGLGTAITGQHGDGTEAFDTTNSLIAVNFGGANSNMTLAKWIEAAFKLRRSNVDTGMGADPIIAMEEINFSALLKNVDEVKNSDYVNVKSLVDNELGKFLGMRVKRFGDETGYIIPKGNRGVSTDYRSVCVWHPSQLCYGVGRQLIGRVSDRSDLSHSTQLYTMIYHGAVRKETVGFIEILCDETA